MTAEALIFRMGEEGKSAQAIAEELNVRGLKGRAGRVFSAADVEGFLRFAGVAGIEPVKISQAAWASRGSPSEMPAETNRQASDPHTPGKNRWKPGSNLTEDQRIDIARLFQREHMKAGEIAAQLGLSTKRVAPFCAHLSGFDVPPGEITEYVDADGHRVLKCPPAFARGIGPQRNVRPTQGGW